jgi:hypothetical protein
MGNGGVKYILPFMVALMQAILPVAAHAGEEIGPPETNYGLSRLIPVSSGKGPTVTVVVQQIAIGSAAPIPAVDLFGDGLVRFALDPVTRTALPTPSGTFSLPMATASHIVSSIITAGIETAGAVSSGGVLEPAEAAAASDGPKLRDGRKSGSKLKGKALRNRLTQALAVIKPAPKPAAGTLK